jgi:hypothetical protein
VRPHPRHLSTIDNVPTKERQAIDETQEVAQPLDNDGVIDMDSDQAMMISADGETALPPAPGRR